MLEPGTTGMATPAPVTVRLTFSSTLKDTMLLMVLVGPAPISYVRVAEMEMVVPAGVPRPADLRRDQ